MKLNYVLIIGSIIIIIFILLWYFEVIGEFIVVLGGVGLILVGYIYLNKVSIKNKREIIFKINQIYLGLGDNIGGDKIVNN